VFFECASVGRSAALILEYVLELVMKPNSRLDRLNVASLLHCSGPSIEQWWVVASFSLQPFPRVKCYSAYPRIEEYAECEEFGGCRSDRSLVGL